MRYSLINRESCRGGESPLCLHREGCKDIKRELQKGFVSMTFEANTLKDALQVVLQDLIDGGHEPGAWKEKDIDTAPCTKS